MFGPLSGGGTPSERGRNNDTASEIILQLAYCLVARLVKALAHLFPIDGTGRQDSVTIQYKKLLKTDCPGVKGVRP
jgi:hypothetical protein